jgi:hypothetical protein
VWFSSKIRKKEGIITLVQFGFQNMRSLVVMWSLKFFIHSSICSLSVSKLLSCSVGRTIGGGSHLFYGRGRC